MEITPYSPTTTGKHLTRTLLPTEQMDFALRWFAGFRALKDLKMLLETPRALKNHFLSSH